MLYNDVANITKNIEIKPYEFALNKYGIDFKKALFSWSIISFYLTIIILTIGFGIFLI